MTNKFTRLQYICSNKICNHVLDCFLQDKNQIFVAAIGLLHLSQRLDRLPHFY